jgi:hypothetical protein
MQCHECGGEMVPCAWEEKPDVIEVVEMRCGTCGKEAKVRCDHG